MSLGIDDVVARLREARDARASCAIATVLDDDHARGFPFATVVPFGLDGQDRVVIVVSDLAVHTRNLRRDPRASVVIAEPGADPQRGWRLTLVGRFVEDDRARAAYAGTWPIPALPDFMPSCCSPSPPASSPASAPWPGSISSLSQVNDEDPMGWVR